jgi:hypothetical protein
LLAGVHPLHSSLEATELSHLLPLPLLLLLLLLLVVVSLSRS